jgi:hypothetical protein
MNAARLDRGHLSGNKLNQNNAAIGAFFRIINRAGFKQDSARNPASIISH